MSFGTGFGQCGCGGAIGGAGYGGAGYGYGAPVGGVGYGGAGFGGGAGSGFALIVVLFILLIIVGAAWC